MLQFFGLLEENEDGHLEDKLIALGEEIGVEIKQEDERNFHRLQGRPNDRTLG